MTNTHALGLVGLYAAGALLFVACDQARSAEIHIRNNSGGVVTDLQARISRLTAKDTVHIEGSCDSACNMYLMQPRRYKVCAAPGAVLGFHMPYYMLQYGNATPVASRGKEWAASGKQDWSSQWLGHFDTKLNKILATATKRGLIPNPSATGDTWSTFNVSATDVLPTCYKGK